MPNPTSPLGNNRALDALAKQLREGERPVTRAAAEEVIRLVEADGKISAEEATTLADLWSTGLKAHDAGEGHTRYGRELLLSYTDVARGRFQAHRHDLDGAVGRALLRLVSFGLFGQKPTYVDVSAEAGTEKGVAERARARANDRLTHEGELERLLEKEYPQAIKHRGGTASYPTPHADVQARYEALKAEVAAGKIDEADPLGPLRAFLEANYG